MPFTLNAIGFICGKIVIYFCGATGIPLPYRSLAQIIGKMGSEGKDSIFIPLLVEALFFSLGVGRKGLQMAIGIIFSLFSIHLSGGVVVFYASLPIFIPFEIGPFKVILDEEKFPCFLPLIIEFNDRFQKLSLFVKLRLEGDGYLWRESDNSLTISNNVSAVLKTGAWKMKMP